eukprot:ANDGO_04556.mRNA.1 hypothetical protein
MTDVLRYFTDVKEFPFNEVTLMEEDALVDDLLQQFCHSLWTELMAVTKKAIHTAIVKRVRDISISLTKSSVDDTFILEENKKSLEDQVQSLQHFFSLLLESKNDDDIPTYSMALLALVRYNELAKSETVPCVGSLVPLANLVLNVPPNSRDFFILQCAFASSLFRLGYQDAVQNNFLSLKFKDFVFAHWSTFSVQENDVSFCFVAHFFKRLLRFERYLYKSHIPAADVSIFVQDYLLSRTPDMSSSAFNALLGCCLFGLHIIRRETVGKKNELEFVRNSIWELLNNVVQSNVNQMDAVGMLYFVNTLCLVLSPYPGRKWPKDLQTLFYKTNVKCCRLFVQASIGRDFTTFWSWLFTVLSDGLFKCEDDVLTSKISSSTMRLINLVMRVENDRDPGKGTLFFLQFGLLPGLEAFRRLSAFTGIEREYMLDVDECLTTLRSSAKDASAKMLLGVASDMLDDGLHYAEILRFSLTNSEDPPECHADEEDAKFSSRLSTWLTAVVGLNAFPARVLSTCFAQFSKDPGIGTSKFDVIHVLCWLVGAGSTNPCDFVQDSLDDEVECTLRSLVRNPQDVDEYADQPLDASSFTVARRLLLNVKRMEISLPVLSRFEGKVVIEWGDDVFTINADNTVTGWVDNVSYGCAPEGEFWKFIVKFGVGRLDP